MRDTGQLSTLYWDQREAAAENLLARARLDSVPAPPLRAVVVALGWQLSASVPRGAHGWLDLETATIHVDDHGDRATVNSRLAHELGHLAAMLACVAHDEQDADAIAAAVTVPRRWLPHTVRAVGWDAPALIGTYPDAPPLEVVARAALFAGGVAVAYVCRQRILAVAQDRNLVPVLPGERDLVRDVRESGLAQRDPRSGIRAWPLHGAYGPMVVLLASNEALNIDKR